MVMTDETVVDVLEVAEKVLVEVNERVKVGRGCVATGQWAGRFRHFPLSRFCLASRLWRDPIWSTYADASLGDSMCLFLDACF